MRVVYLQPNKHGRAIVTLTVFTNKDFGLVADGPSAKYARPCDFQIDLLGSGYFDIDAIESIVKGKYNPQSNFWDTRDNKPILFVPMSESSTKELKEAGVFIPVAGVAKKAASIASWQACFVVKDENAPGHVQPLVNGFTVTALKDGKDSPTKLPGFPVSVSVSLDPITGCHKQTGKYSEQDHGRFCVGIWSKGHFHCGLPIPIALDDKKQLKIARENHSKLSGWCYSPPAPIDFTTTPAILRQLQEDVSGGGKIPAEVSICRLGLLQYCTDGGQMCPEAINCTMFKANPNSKVKYAKRPALWVLNWDGDIIKKGSDGYGALSGHQRGSDGQPAIYAGKAVATRFWMRDKKGVVHSAFSSCMAYAVLFEWYEEMITTHRKELLKVWKRPERSEPQQFHFMTSDWCMRNDANAKRGSKNTAELGTIGIDLYSQPKRHMYQWAIGAYRQNYQSNCGDFPGIQVHKFKVASKDLADLMKYNAQVKVKPAAAAPLQIPVKKG